jgi:large conductance mechanosensitive channel
MDDAVGRARDLSLDALQVARKRSGRWAREFKEFVLRGNVVDLAVGVVIGAAFGAIVNALVSGILTPLLGLLHVKDFSQAQIAIGKHIVKGKVVPSAYIRWGLFVNAVISFLLIAFAVFFFIVKPVNHLMALRKTEPEPAQITRECPECLSKVPIAAKRCAFCTSEIGPVPA